MHASARFTRTTLVLVTGLASPTLGCGGGSADSSTQNVGTESQAGETQSSDADGSGDGDGDVACTPDLESLRMEIFTPSCALPGCHTTADVAGGLDLEATDLEAELVGAPSGTCDGWIRVVPGAPEESLLYAKLAGPAPCGALMPPAGALPFEQQACIQMWIANLEGMSCETCGGDACVDLETDPLHCGSCDNPCPDGVPCSAGSCVCPNGQELCDGACVDTQTDPQDCGGCGSACTPNQVCSMGACADDCGGLTACDGACVDTQTDPNHCGACDNACGEGGTCVMGSCECPGDGVSFAAEVEPVLANACTNMGCHGFPISAAGLDLRLGNAYGDLVNVPSSQCNNRLRVAPGQPGSSYLMDKLQGVNLCFGSKMPKVGPTLSAAQLAAISEWICRGAEDN